ncbi:MAG: type IV pilus twitching motility protein PilT [Fusobacterium varium]|jgi:twitching motility protein PilT|uniref:type IV pilus twitching motility protein PilT n=1 Tax=Fusobacterium TaxID=848 RepID=UPI0008A44B02|nr:MULTISPECIES: PilT/PilU family type 4a pilus ATPase [Fusobacterium]MCD7979182.1 PilT/PilU family type 4a pilus ATPase [Fusobacterium sp.]MCI6031445.1 PilT/PilU family type 4a pilus ATPase [Fusobacterium varium]MDY4006250.1 PilT/PilU family type 4a pilus ATPase [Fusobacterium varium]OFL83373.1 type IV pili twitching motility protein PilT [Fusobacterium sp. HMSC073F01]RGJ32044.1 PilT/PilU family type 4a pilus ATPase [Fusobacterium varium]
MILLDILEKGQEKRASDIHLVNKEKVIYRINGKLMRDEENDEVSEKFLMECIKEILTEKQREIFKEIKEIDTAFEDVKKRRYRINLYNEKGMPAFSIRVLTKKIQSFGELNLPEILKDMIKYENGLVLVTGATGSGKSTTLAAMIEEINQKEALSIVTIEDPIEYIFENKKSFIRQREIGTDTLSFANALKSVLRQDPDIIMVGELRDVESIEAALTAAETGHLVFGTLHTNGAVETINRLIDVFSKEKQEQIKIQLSSVLKGIISQQLLLDKEKEIIPAFEILFINTAVSNYIATGKVNQISTVIETGQKYGMISMREYLSNMYKNGVIDKKS